MNVRRGSCLQLGSVLAMVSAAACHAAHMVVPAELVPAANLPVAGRQGFLPGRQLRFGSVEARELKRSWVRGNERQGEEWPGHRIAEGRYEEHYSFRLYDGTREIWQVRCDTEVHAVAAEALLGLTAFRRELALECWFRSPSDSGGGWRLVLNARGDRMPTGHMAGEGRSLQIEATASLAGTPIKNIGPSGYYVRDGRRALAAVEVLGDGAVRLAPDLTNREREVLTGAATALLLFDDLQHVTDQLTPE